MSRFGYAGAVLKVDLTTGKMVDLPSENYTDRFIGGRGLAANLFWDLVPPETKAFDPENCVIFATGPLAGFNRVAGSRWLVCGKSAAMEPQYFSYGNLGGSWGAHLKFAGYDGVAVVGKADKLSYILIRDGKAEIKDAAHLHGKDAIQTREILKSELGKEVHVATTGLAGENMVNFANVIADEDSSGAGGLGAVMGSKNLKAVAVAGSKIPVAAHPERLSQVADVLFHLRGQHGKRPSKWAHEGRTHKWGCFGCVAGCNRQYYETDDGEKIKFFCHFGDMYEDAVVKRYGKWNEVVVRAAGMVHRYALDSFVIEPMVLWLGKCYQAGILTEAETGLPLSRIGTAEFLESLIRKISHREGFGDILALGTLRAAEKVGKGSAALIGDSIITRASDYTMYDPRMYITNGLLYGTEPRKPIQQLHEITVMMHNWVGSSAGVHSPSSLTSEEMNEIAERFWGGKLAVDMSKYEGKALAAKKIQDRAYVKESLVVCDFLWPVMMPRGVEEKVGDPTLESQVYSAITGVEVDKDGLDRLGEGVFNLQRAVRMREGWGGRRGDRLRDVFYTTPIETARFNENVLVPGKDGIAASRKGCVVEEDKFENMKGEYYALRGWDVESGYQTVNGLNELGMADIAEDLKKRGLAK